MTTDRVRHRAAGRATSSSGKPSGSGRARLAWSAVDGFTPRLAGYPLGIGKRDPPALQGLRLRLQAVERALQRVRDEDPLVHHILIEDLEELRQRYLAALGGRAEE